MSHNPKKSLGIAVAVAMVGLNIGVLDFLFSGGLPTTPPLAAWNRSLVWTRARCF